MENSYEVIPGTEKYISTDDILISYSAGENNDLKFAFKKRNKYGAQTYSNITKIKKKNFMWILAYIYGISPPLGAAIIAISSGTPAGSAFLAGGLLSLGTLGPVIAIDKGQPRNKNKIKTIMASKDFFKDVELQNEEVVISSSASNKELIRTIKNGILVLSPEELNLSYTAKNDPLVFKFHFSNKNKNEVLSVLPSEFLNFYARIEKPLAYFFIGNSFDTHNKVSATRLGMEYNILEKKGKYFKIELPSGESGWIDKSNVETFYSVERKPDIKQAIQLYVEQEIAKWQQQGEFELPEAYLERMEKRQEKIDELVEEAVLMYQQDYKELFEWEKSTISNYNPNNQVFRVTVPQLGEFDIHVPVEYAPDFKSNWPEKIISNQKFLLVDGNWELASMDIKVPEIEYTATYNSQVENFYNQSTQFNISFEPVEISLAEEKSKKEHRSTELQELSYNISANLPATKSSNPDAIAVIIGNAYYQHTNSVKYAINDAQLMKNYLVNVLGYREGNVFFEKNITKGTFENYFGTGNNSEGKLASLVKEDISDVFIYYSGHGFPDRDGKAYFLPSDAEPNLVQLGGYSINTFYQNLAGLNAKTVTIVLDACFSGYGIDRNVSGIRIRRDVKQNIERGTILSSSKANEESTWLDQQQHGLFTYFFLRAIHNKEMADVNRDNKLTIREIYEYVSDKTEGVPYYARRLHNIEQNPEAIGDMDMVLVEY
jgi:hypothetical protein